MIGDTPPPPLSDVNGNAGTDGIAGGGGGGGGAGLLYDSATVPSPSIVAGKVTIIIPGAGSLSRGTIRGGPGGSGSCAAQSQCGGGGGGGAGLVIHNDSDYTLEIQADRIFGGDGGSGSGSDAGAGGGGAAAVIFGSSPVIINMAENRAAGAVSSIFSGKGGGDGANSGDGLILNDGNNVIVRAAAATAAQNKIIHVDTADGTATDPNVGKLGTAVVFSGSEANLMLQGGMNIEGGTPNGTQESKTGLAVYFRGNGNRLTLTTNDMASSISQSPNSQGVPLSASEQLVLMHGDNNTIELHPNTSIEGILNSTGTNNGIVLGGMRADSENHPSTFDLSKLVSGTYSSTTVTDTPFYGIERLEKTGASWWTVDNAQESAAPWTIIEGRLVMGLAGDLQNSSKITIGTPDTQQHLRAMLNLGNLATGSIFKIQGLAGSGRGLIDDCGQLAPGEETCAESEPRSNAKLVITNAQSDEYAGQIQTKSGLEVAGGTQIFTGDVNNLGNVAITGTGVLQLGNDSVHGALADLPVQIDTNATLVFKRSNEIVFGSVLTGSGTIEQNGTDQLSFNADSSSFNGQTLLNVGSLWIEDNAVLGGTVAASSGTTLAGKGTIVGDTTTSDNATFNGQQGYVFTFRSDLMLSNATNVNVKLGPATNFSALFDVRQDLTLDGVLNIEDLGAFGPGRYRLFDYGGNLTDNIMTIGTVPTHIDPQLLSIDASTQHQVDLLFGGTIASLNYWDGGDPAKHNNNQVDGGDGTWDTINNNWTTKVGAPNGPWDNGNYAMFEGSAGTVKVDNNPGDIRTKGLVFSVGGYRLVDQHITLVDTNTTPVIRVGNSSSASDSMIATVASELRGTQGFKKTDLGTLILTGNNTYTGVTTISQGIVQLGDGGTTGSILGDVVVESNIYDYGTLAFNRSDETDFNGQISGDGAVLQNGSGVTVFKGDNNFTGGLTVAQGTARAGIVNHAFGAGLLNVQAGAMADLDGFNTTVGGLTGSGNVTLRNAALSLDQNFDTTFSGNISGNGDLIKNGTGIFTLTGPNSYTGNAVVNDGTLFQGQSRAFSQTAVYMVGQDAVLAFGGFETKVAGLTNSGAVRFGGTGGTTITVNGNYIGADGSLLMNVVLQGDGSKTDMLKVLGDTAGSTSLRFINRGGTGEQTVEGIKVVDIVGQSNGNFSLNGDYTTWDGEKAIVAGAFAYTLHKGGVSTPGDGDWYLRSELKDGPGPRYGPAIPVYEGMIQAMQALNSLPTLQQRTGNRYWSDANETAAKPDRKSSQTSSARLYDRQDAASNRTVWGRIEGAHNHFEPATSATATSVNVNVFQLQAGVDGQFYENHLGKLVGSITGQYGTSHSNISSIYGDGSIQMQGWSLGTALTWYGDSGFYADGQAQATWYDSDLSSSTSSSDIADSRKGFGYALSIETGKRFGLNDHWSLTPQIQLMWSSVSFNSFNDIWGADVSLHDGDSLRGRLGLSADYRNTWYGADGTFNLANIYGIVNLYQDFLGDMRFKVADVTFDTANSRTWGGIGGGGTYSWASERYAIYGEGSLNSPLNRLGDSYTVKGSVGFKVRW
ncbi:autotransporter outer membrane beta-barrel domain-containing protein [Ochrobactrum teleogrylli]|uniref:Autotransporter outer membrane beta-barrel domain-containing protein n=1 Tax=Ochrobactrum teleogrylli TaxID=2479765 RepID=A0ABY2Y208_9HYPH|nr:autotransporter outer membrane beta-barrel domain-containing protein [[Ochrobactrum] teleogrylli]TNV13861.1 autotransporter outer membrane beta-barrel domain-containing protein [[Ochrobactrum] teleogrylli]